MPCRRALLFRSKHKLCILWSSTYELCSGIASLTVARREGHALWTPCRRGRCQALQPKSSGFEFWGSCTWSSCKQGCQEAAQSVSRPALLSRPWLWAKGVSWPALLSWLWLGPKWLHAVSWLLRIELLVHYWPILAQVSFWNICGLWCTSDSHCQVNKTALWNYVGSPCTGLCVQALLQGMHFVLRLCFKSSSCISCEGTPCRRALLRRTIVLHLYSAFV